MTSRASSTVDRELLLNLVSALNVSKTKLSRDPCGDWNIFGRRGHISTDGTALYVHLSAPTRRRWETVKRTLSFATVTQDGGDEGVLKLVGLPTPEQAETLRKLVGLRRVSALTEGQRSALRRFSFSRDKPGVSDRSIPFAEERATRLAPTIQAPDAPNPWPMPRSVRQSRANCAPGPHRVSGAAPFHYH